MFGEVTDARAAKVIDLRRRTRPQGLVELFRAVRGVRTGESVEVVATDPGLGYEIARWAHEMGHPILAIVEEPGYSRILIERGPWSGIDREFARQVAS